MPGPATTVSAELSSIGPLQRAWWAPLPVHAVALLALLAVLVAVVGDRGVFSSDEGAGIAQAEAVAHGDWGLRHPVAEVDPAGQWFPLEKARGTTERHHYAPLPKKPAYSWLGAQVWSLGGARALMGLSAVGAVTAALLAASIARKLDPRLDRAALWTAGLASPLLADGLLVIAHTLAAAAAGAVMLGVIRWLRQPASVSAMLIVGASAAGVLLRAEAALISAAMCTALLVLAVVRRERWLVPPALLVAAGTIVGLALDSRLTDRLFGGPIVSVPAKAASSAATSYVDDRLAAFVTTWLRPGYGGVEAPQLLGILLVLAGVGAVVLSRRGEDAWVLRALWAGVVALAAARVLWRAPAPDLVPGLLVAFPLLVWGLLSLPRRAFRELGTAVCGLTLALFAAAVLATQYREGGAWEWGGRYFAAGIPIAVPLIVLGGREGLHRLDGPTRRAALAAVVAVALSTATLQVLAVRDSHVLSGDLVEVALLAAARTPPGDEGLPVIISTEPELPRTAWKELDQARWLHVPVSDVPEALERLSSAGVERLVLATRAAPRVMAEVRAVRDQLDGVAPPADLWWFTAVEIR